AIDGIEIRLDNPDATDSIVDTLSDELGPNYRVQDWKELNRSLFSALKLEKYAMFLVLGIVILVASFAIIGNLLMSPTRGRPRSPCSRRSAPATSRSSSCSRSRDS